MQKKKAVFDVDDYVANQRDELKSQLSQIRKIIRSMVPDAEEVISYQIPCYKYYGMLVGFGVHKNGCSFYTMSNTILSSLTKELGDLRYAGSTIHLDSKKKLPVALLKKIIRLRTKHNEERNWLKQISKP
jgi:uncharacterized protein YdhG (YjbR/CyaY superfamily)